MHRFPFVCVSISLAAEGRPLLGVVYNPILGELFTAIRGQGAFLNGALMAMRCCARTSQGKIARHADRAVRPELVWCDALQLAGWQRVKLGSDM